MGLRSRSGHFCLCLRVFCLSHTHTNVRTHTHTRTHTQVGGAAGGGIQLLHLLLREWWGKLHTASARVCVCGGGGMRRFCIDESGRTIGDPVLRLGPPWLAAAATPALLRLAQADRKLARTTLAGGALAGGALSPRLVTSPRLGALLRRRRKQAPCPAAPGCFPCAREWVRRQRPVMTRARALNHARAHTQCWW